MWSALPLFHVTALGCRDLGAGPAARRSSATTPSTPSARSRPCATSDHAVLSRLPAGHGGGRSRTRDFDKADLSPIDTWLNVAPPEVLAKFQKRLPHAVQLTTYGGTEGGCVR